MSTDTKGLLDAGMAISDAMWTDARAAFDWAAMDRYVAHQVSQVHTAAMCRDAAGSTPDRVPRSFPLRGNMGPASIPFTLATQVDSLQTGDRVLLMGVGSGPQRVLHRAGAGDAPRSPRAGLPGLDPAWSRLVTDARGHRWHVLDHGRAVHGTLVCVHGNPTWSYLWRRFVAAAPPGWRVVAVDQLGMGFSQRGPARTLADRVDDLGRRARTRSTSTGPVVTAGTTGAVRSRWAGRCVTATGCRAVVLTNTAVHQPAGAAAPSLIRLARTPGAAARGVRGDADVRAGHHGAVAASLPAAVRDAYAAPYATADRRRAVGSSSRTSRSSRAIRQRRDARRDRRGGPQARRRPGAAAVGAARPGVLRPLPARPACAAAARATSSATSGRRTSCVEDADGAGRRSRGPGSTARRDRGTDRRDTPWQRPIRVKTGADVGRRARRDLWTATRAPRRRRLAPPCVELSGERRSISWDLLVRRVHETGRRARRARGAPPATGSRCSSRPAPT